MPVPFAEQPQVDGFTSTDGSIGFVWALPGVHSHAVELYHAGHIELVGSF
jgi:hypothetical protein